MAPQTLLSRAFHGHQVAAVRHAITPLAAQAGLAGERLDDFLMAVNEVITNAVRHGGGSGHLRLWVVDGALCCEVTDQGPGIPAEQVRNHDLPSTYSLGGRGIWLARRLCDNLSLTTGPWGTRIRLSHAIAP